MSDSAPAELHPAEHRGYRELYAASRHLVQRWGRLISSLEATPYAAILEAGRERIEALLEALPAKTEPYGLYGGFAAQGVGARIADVRAVLADHSVDTGMVMRLAVLDVEHLATLLAQLAALAGARGDSDLASFSLDWEAAVRNEVTNTRVAAISIGEDPDRAAAPLDDSALGRAAHGVGWVLGSVGEAVDRVVGRRR